jgi:hypothetical protein
LYDVSNPTDRVTNLYGVVLIDNVTDTASNGYIQRFEKFKPNLVTGLNGNSYGLKLNMNFDTSVDNSTIETIINDYSQFSMDLFIDASTRMQEAAAMFMDTELDIIDLKQRIQTLENFTFTQQQLTDVSQRLSDLETSLNNAKLAFASMSSAMSKSAKYRSVGIYTNDSRLSEVTAVANLIGEDASLLDLSGNVSDEDIKKALGTTTDTTNDSSK